MSSYVESFIHEMKPISSPKLNNIQFKTFKTFKNLRKDLSLKTYFSEDDKNMKKKKYPAGKSSKKVKVC